MQCEFGDAPLSLLGVFGSLVELVCGGRQSRTGLLVVNLEQLYPTSQCSYFALLLQSDRQSLNHIKPS